MTKGINKVILIGNLGADPEVRYMPNGEAVANLTIATSGSWTDKQTNEKKEHTEWHKLVIYKRLAEIAGEYLRKGSKVYVEGKLKTRKWQDQQGIDRYTTEIVVNELQMLDSKQDGQQKPQSQHQPTTTSPSRQQQTAQPQQPRQDPPQYQQQQRPPMQQNHGAPIDFDQDIPFAPIGLHCQRLLHCM